MTDRPENYAPPKHRAAMADALRKVESEAERAVAEAVRQPHTEPEPEKVESYASLGSQAIQRYFDAAAKHMEQAGDEMLKEAQAARDDLYSQAEDVRHTARMLTAAVDSAALRTKTAALGITDIRAAFRDSVNKERADAEATKQRMAG